MQVPTCLFCCESVFQLFNSIIIRLTLKENMDCDVLFTEHTDFGEIPERIRQSGIFKKVYESDCNVLEKEYWNLNEDEQIERFSNPLLFFQDNPPVDQAYDEMFIPIDHLCLKMIYYFLLREKGKPNLFMYEEGLRSYTMNVAEKQKVVSTNDEAVFREDAFGNSILGLYLYKPELHLIDVPYEKISIPGNFADREDIKNAMNTIFSIPPAPEEKYIYFEESYLHDRIVSNDFELLEMVAEIVGKQNIIVKRHPRNPYDRYTPRGYKIMREANVPWEVYFFNERVKDKIFITVASTASLTQFLVFNMFIPTIHLIKMFNATSPLMKDQGFYSFYKNFLDTYNAKKQTIYTPYSQKDCQEIIRFLQYQQ